jgi:hypothetical protein
MARAVLEGIAHHLKERGLDRRRVFFDDGDYEVHLEKSGEKRGQPADRHGTI